MTIQAPETATHDKTWKKKRIVILDQNELSRAGFTFLIRGEENFEVTELPETTRQEDHYPSLIEMLENSRLDLILIAEEEDLLDNIKKLIVTVAPTQPPPIVAFANRWEKETAMGALRLGVRGLGMKSGSRDTIMAAIRAVSVGGTYLTPAVADGIIEAALDKSSEPNLQALAKVATLTERERRVLTFLASGLTTTEIASQLIVSRATVKSHISHMLQKLGLQDRVQAVVFAYTSGLAVGPDEVLSDRPTV
jgi:DNA-binding NarL/FixJ family response regulator